MSSTGTAGLSAAERLRHRRLRSTRRMAGSLLALVSAVFVVVTVLGGSGAWAGYVQAGAIAGMVGGLADWFAVTALFRRPLGLPIPHTAIVVRRKDHLAGTIGAFVQERLLAPSVIVARLAEADVVSKVGAWLADPSRSALLARHLCDGAIALSEVVGQEEVHDTLESLAREAAGAVPLAPLAGRVLGYLSGPDSGGEVLDAALVGAERYLGSHGDELRRRLGGSSPWWMPGMVEERILERLLAGARSLLAEMAKDHDHEVRRSLQGALERLALDLQSSPELRARGERLKAQLLDQPQLRTWVRELWDRAREELRAQAADPGSRLRQRLASILVGAGHRLLGDRALADSARRATESAVVYLCAQFEGEIASLAAGAIGRWDAAETSRRLELLLGADLQYVRINGCVVGAMAGLALHALAQALA